MILMMMMMMMKMMMIMTVMMVTLNGRYFVFFCVYINVGGDFVHSHGRGRAI